MPDSNTVDTNSHREKGSKKKASKKQVCTPGTTVNRDSSNLEGIEKG